MKKRRRVFILFAAAAAARPYSLAALFIVCVCYYLSTDSIVNVRAAGKKLNQSR